MVADAARVGRNLPQASFPNPPQQLEMQRQSCEAGDNVDSFLNSRFGLGAAIARMMKASVVDG